MSHIIFSKFSLELRQIFKWELKTEYPTFAEILANYYKVTNQLGSVKAKKVGKNQQISKFNNFNKQQKSKNKNNSGFNFNTQVQKFIPHCRFCVTDGHSSADCTTNATYQQRLSKCGELKLCT